MAETIDEVLRGRLVARIHPNSSFLEGLQQDKPKTLHELYSRAELHENGEKQEGSEHLEMNGVQKLGRRKENFVFHYRGRSCHESFSSQYITGSKIQKDVRS